MKLAEGSIKAFKYWPDTGNKYGDFSMSVLMDEGPNGENWYGFGNCAKEAWNRRVSEGVFEEVQIGAVLSFPYEEYVSKAGNAGRSAKRSMVSFTSYGSGGTGGTGGAKGGSSAPPSTDNNPAEVGQILNLAMATVQFRNPKGWTWDDVSAEVPATIAAVQELKKSIDSQLTAAKQPVKKTESKSEPESDDFDDDIPF
jgi:hypothetical protein